MSDVRFSRPTGCWRLARLVQGGCRVCAWCRFSPLFTEWLASSSTAPTRRRSFRSRYPAAGPTACATGSVPYFRRQELVRVGQALLPAPAVVYGMLGSPHRCVDAVTHSRWLCHQHCLTLSVPRPRPLASAFLISGYVAGRLSQSAGLYGLR